MNRIARDNVTVSSWLDTHFHGRADRAYNDHDMFRIRSCKESTCLTRTVQAKEGSISLRLVSMLGYLYVMKSVVHSVYPIRHRFISR